MIRKDRLKSILVRPMALTDIPAVIALQEQAVEHIRPWTPEQLEEHLRVFPRGQMVAVDSQGRLVGTSSTLVIDWDDYDELDTFQTITDHGRFRSHNPEGQTLYGADIVVDPRCQRQGIGSMLYEARKAIVVDLGLKRFLAGGRIPGYEDVKCQLSATEYVAQVVAGERSDPTLSFQLQNGFTVLATIPDYMGSDTQSAGFATLLEWLNPYYASRISLGMHEQAESADAAPPLGRHRPSRRVRLAAVQYALRPVGSFEEFATQVEYCVHGAADYRSHFVLLPELFTMQLMSCIDEPDPVKAIRRLAAYTPEYERLFTRLARETGMYIVAGSHPTENRGEIRNTAHLFTPRGRIFRQDKVHLTRAEKTTYKMARGHQFRVFDTEHGRVAILICYDVEFPEAARLVSEVGTEILFVPSWTDDRQGFCRVRYCAQARAIENQIYVVATSTVGNLPKIAHMATHYGQAAILTPSDFLFARDGLAAEGNYNQEQIVVSDVDLDLLEERRINGTVIPILDQIQDAYDYATLFSDLAPEPGAPTSGRAFEGSRLLPPRPKRH